MRAGVAGPCFGAPDAQDGAGRHGLARLVGGTGCRAVALDYDGTLAPIVPDPEAAVPVAGAAQALHRAAGVFGTVAIDHRPDPRVAAASGSLPSDLVVLASHGHERWPRGPGRTRRHRHGK